jgi:hypothetical protein
MMDRHYFILFFFSLVIVALVFTHAFIVEYVGQGLRNENICILDTIVVKEGQVNWQSRFGTSISVAS